MILKVNHQYIITLVVLFFSSCWENRLREFTVRDNEIEVTKYELSGISDNIEFVEVRKEDSTIKVMEANPHGFCNIIIRRDSIIIQSLPTIVYDFKSQVFGYSVYIDTTISVDYYQQKIKEQAEK